MRVCLLLLIVITACQNSDNSANSKKPVSIVRYVLEAGRLCPLEAAQQHHISVLPWTRQTRIADLLLLGDSLYLAVNNYGLLKIDFAGDAPVFKPYYVPDKIKDRTVTRLFRYQNRIIGHYYFDDILSPPSVRLVPQPNLFIFDPPSGLFEDYVMPFKQNHPGWELKSFFLINYVSGLCEWKSLGFEQNSFAYTEFYFDSTEERTVSQAEFRAQYAQTYRASNWSSRAAQVQDYLSARLALSDSSVLFTIRTSDSYNLSGCSPADKIPVVVPVFSGENQTLLTYESELVRFDAHGRRLLDLNLPSPSIRVTDICQVGTKIILVWEEASFFNVADCGIIIISDWQ